MKANRLHIRALISCIMLCAGMSGFAQEVPLQGTVTDAVTGVPVPGAGIIVKGSSRGVATDIDGKFSINVSQGEVLTVSCIGYKEQEFTAGAQRELTIALETETNMLDGVILMGYSSVKKTELSSSAVSVKGEELNRITTKDMGTMLQGKVAGVTVYSPSGQPGSQATIRIRGTGSISADSSPLYVVDGIIGGSFNVNDVESVTVLKDAGATALYGASGAGGVIVVTTKKAKAGEKFNVEADAKAGVKQLLTGRLKMMETPELLEYWKTFMTKGFLSKLPKETTSNSYDWLKASSRLGVTQDYYLSASGSRDRVSYLASLNWYGEKGTQIFSDYSKFNAHLDLDAEILKNLFLNVKMNYSADKTHYGYTFGLGMLPLDNPYDTVNGGFVAITGATRPDNGELWWSHDKSNPLYAPSVNTNEGRGGNFTGDIALKWNITDYLSISSTNRYTDVYFNYRDIIVPEANNGTYPEGRVQQNYDWGRSFFTSNLLRFSKVFGDGHGVSAFAGFEWGTSWSEYMGASGVKLSNGLKMLSTSIAESVSGGRTEIENYSWFVQAQYSYKERYIINGSVRADASSVFAPKNRTGYFPAVSAAWLASGEEFMKKQDVVSLLKLRASWGETGNSGLKPYSYLDIYEFPRVCQYQGEIGGIPSTLENPYLHWEKAVMANLGIDLGFRDFLSLSIDLYNNENRDLLLQVPQSPSTGFQSRTENTGTIRNRGIEILIESTNFNLRNFRWTTSFNLGHNKNVVVSLPEHEDIVMASATGGQIYREGEPLYSWYMPKWLGVNPDNGQPQWESLTTDEEGNLVRGVTSSLDTTRDRQIVGCAQPKLSGGMNNSFSFYGVDISLDLSFIWGNQVFNFNRRTYDSDGAYSDINAMSLDNGLGWSRWKQAGDIATHPKPVPGGNKSANEVTSRYLEDGSYLRVKNLTVSYTLPQKALRAMKMKDFKIYFSGDNLFTFSKFSGMDPEVDLSSTLSSSILAGTYVDHYPVGRLYSLGIKLLF